MTSFGWLPAPRAPATTAKGLPMAVSTGLKRVGLQPFPRTTMAVGSSNFNTAVRLAAAQMQAWGLRYTPSQLVAEMSNRGYTYSGFSGFGNGPIGPAGPYGPGTPQYESVIREQVAEARMDKIRGWVLPLAIGGGLLLWAIKKGR